MTTRPACWTGAGTARATTSPTPRAHIPSRQAWRMTDVSDDSKAIYLRLLRRVLPYWRTFALGTAMMIVLGLTEPAFPAILDMVVSSFEQRALDGAPLHAALFLGVFFIRGLSSFLSVLALESVAARLVLDLRQDMFDRLMRIPAPAYDNVASGSLISKVTFDAQQVTEAADPCRDGDRARFRRGTRPSGMDAVDRLEAHAHRPGHRSNRHRRRRLFQPAAAADVARTATHDGGRHPCPAGEHRRPQGGQGVLRPGVREAEVHGRGKPRAAGFRSSSSPQTRRQRRSRK